MQIIKHNYFPYLLTVVALLGFIFSCTRKADVPQPTVQTPIFGTSCLIGKDSVKLYAGQNGYYLNTSYSRDSAGTLILSGELIKQNCTTCTSGLKIAIYDDTARSSITNIATVLATGSRKYTNHGTVVIIPPRVVKFTEEFTGASYIWSFGDGNSTAAVNPTHTYATGGQYQVCLSVTDSTKTHTVCNNIVVDDTKNCNIQFSSGGVTSSYTVTFTATAGHSYYAWNFGDNTGTITSNPLSSPSIAHAFISGPGVYKVKVIARNTNGCDSVFTKYIPVVSTIDTSGAAYSYTILPGSTTTSSSNFSKAIITWTNSSGQQYSSRRASGTQPSQSFFTITNSGPYKTDNNGHATYKFSARLQAILYNTGNPLDSISISTDKLVMAVAYP